MAIKTVIKKICLDKDITLAELANFYGIQPNSFYIKLCRNTLPFTEVVKIMDILNCDVQFKDRKTGRVYE